MSPDQVERLFIAFTQVETQTARRFGGTGLGGGLTRRVDRPFGVLPCTGAAFRPFDRFESDRAGGM
jgi:hypothetical protein